MGARSDGSRREGETPFWNDSGRNLTAVSRNEDSPSVRVRSVAVITIERERFVSGVGLGGHVGSRKRTKGGKVQNLEQVRREINIKLEDTCR